MNEKNVSFKPFSMDTIDPKAEIDALFIMPEYVTKAAESEYAEIYHKLPYPIFWMDSKKPHYAFTEPDLNLENAPGNFNYYAYGYLYQDKQRGAKGWSIGLDNHEKNEENIREAFSNIFKIIIDEKEKGGIFHQ
ncbi:hypothetical protein IC620_10230 [Hazenella sp. IB182357]|uniref:Uncharacterized protein n=1 Tax=Polycladospora coralii TaxID=2771432 RepID=A0A926RUB0_9BACL|nr:hypothetical protein [Polycladospora coralii]MBD1372733.1 hypothetical protein [Polycladospora coralii]MBS7531124.1 hypothetical protein [Polycladospora coralii]